MTVWLLAGGGTAGHVNPLLAVGDAVRRRRSGDEVLVLGTAEGLESRLVPARGYELLTVPRLPFPRRLDRRAASFLPAFGRAVDGVVRLLRDREVDAVVGFGGYAAAPAYLAARRARIPFGLHEANARPGLANRLGARFTDAVGVAFEGTPLPHARLVGMPLRREIEMLDRDAARTEGLSRFGLRTDAPVLLVTGGSLGARRINTAVADGVDAVLARGWQVLHITGRQPAGVEAPHERAGYRVLEYCDRMELALAVADLALSRSGAGTVSELAALGVPSVLVPYPVGNGEQRYNARGLVAAGGAVIVEDARVTPDWVRGDLATLVGDRERVAAMASAARGVGIRDGADRMLDLLTDRLKLRHA